MSLNKGEVLCDMFCGIGPLALKAAAKKGVKVLANDLNPACFEFLEKNIALNKMSHLVKPHCMDARDFVKMVINKSSVKLSNEEEKQQTSSEEQKSSEK